MHCQPTVCSHRTSICPETTSVSTYCIQPQGARYISKQRVDLHVVSIHCIQIYPCLLPLPHTNSTIRVGKVFPETYPKAFSVYCLCRSTIPFPNTVIPFDTLESTFWSSIKLSSNMAQWSHYLTTTIASRSSCSLAWSSAQTFLTVVKSDPIARTDNSITGLDFTVCIWLRDFKQTQLRQSLVVYLLWMFMNPLNICWPFGIIQWPAFQWFLVQWSHCSWCSFIPFTCWMLPAISTVFYWDISVQSDQPVGTHSKFQPAYLLAFSLFFSPLTI